jgi:mono/diheme cytochrome c family protein
MTWLKRGGIALALLVLIVAIAAVVGLFLGQRRAARLLDVPAREVALRDDAEAVARGRYLFNSRGCTDCHGASGGGATIAEGGGTHLAGPNLTAGSSVIARYRPVDWDRSIRHGVGPDGRALRLMPSEDYNRLTDVDLASLVAYLRQLPKAPGRERGVIELPLPARVLYGFGAIPEAATKIDHALPPSQPVPEGVTAEHGRYVAQSCVGCHGANLQGGKIAGAPPDWPAAARLAPGPDSVMKRYSTREAFVAMMRSGRRPDGSAIGVMPFDSLGTMSDIDLGALHVYLTRS